MGVVLKALDKSLDRTVAIKVMAPHLATNGAARKRFAREAKAAAAVLHPNVMAIHSVSSGDSLPFLVMPYLRGTSLQKRLDAEGPLPVGEILRIAAQTAAGLAAAHAQGLVHRDIKPANILLEEGVERVAITDFGLARAVDDATMTRTGVVAGTPQYMSPEQARGEPLEQRSDLFSLGSVLYAMCTGRPPFRAESSYGVLRRITDEEPKSIREINPDIPEWLCPLISRLMAKSPDARFANALEVASLLEQCLAHVQQPTSVPLPASLVPHAAGRRSIFNVTRKGVLAMLGTIGMTLLGIVLWQATEAPDISGQWTSEEWGTVVLEAKGSGEYEGTFTGSGKDKAVPRNDQPAMGSDSPGSSSTPAGASEKRGSTGPGPNSPPLLGRLPKISNPSPGAETLGGSDQDKPATDQQGNLRAGNADAELYGNGKATLFTVSDGKGTLDLFKGVDGKPSTLHLKWSRVERRFNGTWGKGADRRGTMSLRLVDKEIRGGFTTDEEVQLETGTPLVGDLSWKRSVVTVPDGGNALLRELQTVDETVPSPVKIPLGDIRVDIYAGRGLWYSKDEEVFKLLHSVKSLRGVTFQVHEDGKGDAFTKALVHDPAPVRAEPAENQKREERIRTIKIAIDEALRAHKVPNVRWHDANGNQQDGPAAKGFRLDKPVDRQNARAVVEAWVAAVIAKDVKTASSLAKHHPARADQIEAWGSPPRRTRSCVANRLRFSLFPRETRSLVVG